MRLPFEFTLAACSSLRTLTLHCPIALQSTVPWVNMLLADVSPAELENVTLEVRLLGSLDALDWVRMEEILLQDDFKKLQTVSIKVAVWHTALQQIQNIKKFMRTRMPNLHSREMLRFID